MNRYPLAAGATCLFTLLVACSSSSAPGASPSGAPTSGGIVITNFKYTGPLTVKTGQQVTVTNDDTTDHTLTDQPTLNAERQGGQTPGGQTQAGPTAQFSTGTIDPSGGTRSFAAPAAPGSYPFGCRVHPAMKGTLIVQGGT